MVFIVGDQSQICALYESGTWASSSGAAFWLGEVTNNTINEDMGVIPNRYAGTASRNVAQWVDGPQKFVGTMSVRMQNARMFKFLLGSCVDGGSPSPFQHLYSETNNGADVFEIAGQSLPSFTVEDAQVTTTGSNFVRTLNGCWADSASIKATEGNPLVLDLNYVAKTGIFGSGAKTSVTADTQQPYMWRHLFVQIPSGTTYSLAKDFSLEIKNNLVSQHYLDGSRTIGLPIPTNRDYMINVTLNADNVRTKTLYENYFLGGSEFQMLVNATITAGSREFIVTGSNCKLLDFSSATTAEGVQQQTLTISPRSLSVIENSEIQYINSGSASGF